MVENLQSDPFQVDQQTYTRFSEANIAYHRLYVPQSEWQQIQGAKTLAIAQSGRPSPDAPHGEPGDTLLHYAMRKSFGAIRSLATPHLGRFGGRSLSGRLSTRERADLSARVTSDPARLTEWVKRVARMCGAALVGIARLDPRWVYGEVRRDDKGAEGTILKPILIEDSPRPRETDEALILPSSMRRAIVVAVAMDREAILTAPSMLADAATGLGYSRASAIAVLVARTVQAAGFQAMPSLNDTALTIPMAVQAGLGELGRHGLLITPEHGPCVRLAKILTDMPLAVDEAGEHGLQAHCDACRECADACPGKAISGGSDVGRTQRVQQLWGAQVACGRKAMPPLLDRLWDEL